MPPDHEGVPHPRRQMATISAACAVTLPGLLLRLTGAHVSHYLEAVLFGLAIVGAAFILSWAAEVAQLDLSAGLAIAILAFIAVLPEYAVDLVFAWKGGNAVQEFGPTCMGPGAQGESACSLALANMTGANRLLIGIGWSLVVFLAYFQWRRRNDPTNSITLERKHSVELAFLAIASLYSLSLPLKRSITLIDAAILVGLFAAYTVRISRAPAEEPHLVGPARYVGSFSVTRRRGSVIGMFLFAAFVIVACAEHFAEALVATGAEFGVSEFLLVQWLAPLASEAPELLVAGLYAWRLNTNAGLGTLVSSKVNQWTLLVGSLPIVFAIASGSLSGLPIIARQREELLLTAAQSVFAVAILSNLDISVKEAGALFGLFWAQFIVGAFVPEDMHGAELIGVSVVYLVLAAFILLRRPKRFGLLFRDGVRTDYEEMAAAE
ncbi:MAG: sodium:proton exchanger [Actinomycetota bacterium]|nr:sodium:proton exchanger [Actinomycetota bacterium]